MPASRALALAWWKRSEVASQLIADADEKRQPVLFGSLEGGRIFEVVVNRHGLGGKDRAAFFGIIANG